MLKPHAWTWPVEVVKAYFPQYEWYEWLFRTARKRFSHKPENRRRYYAWLGEKLGYRQPADWWRLTCDDLWNNYGTTLFNLLPSLAEVRKECCPEMEREYERRKDVTAEQVIRWADEHLARCGKWRGPSRARSSKPAQPGGPSTTFCGAACGACRPELRSPVSSPSSGGAHQPSGSAAIIHTVDSLLGQRLFRAARRVAEARLGTVDGQRQPGAASIPPCREGPAACPAGRRWCALLKERREVVDRQG